MAPDDDNEVKEAPTVLDTESDEEKVGDGTEVIDPSSQMRATRDEMVAEVITKNASDSHEDSEDEIESARAELRESEEEDEENEEPEEDSDDSSNLAYFQRVIEKVDGKPLAAMENLKLHLTGEVVLAVSDRKEGYQFQWKDQKVKVNHWSGSQPKGASCVITTSEHDLEQILRGRLNPQVAMLSHKVDVSGEMSHAVYFFNLFSSGRR